MPDSHDIDQIIEDLKTIQEQFATKLEELTLARQAQIDDELERSYKEARRRSRDPAWLLGDRVIVTNELKPEESDSLPVHLLTHQHFQGTVTGILGPRIDIRTDAGTDIRRVYQDLHWLERPQDNNDYAN